MESSLHEEYVKLKEPGRTHEPQRNREGIAQGKEDHCDDSDSIRTESQVGARLK